MTKVLCFAFLSICLLCNAVFAGANRCVMTTTSWGDSDKYLFPSGSSTNKGQKTLICGGRDDDVCAEGTKIGVKRGHFLGNRSLSYAGAVYKCDGGKWKAVTVPTYDRSSPFQIDCSVLSNHQCDEVGMAGLCCEGNPAGPRKVWCKNPRFIDHRILEACGNENLCRMFGGTWNNGTCVSATSQPASQQQAPQQTSSNSGQTQTNNQNNSGQRNYSGVIKDKDTGEPLQFVNISVPGTQSGCTTDAEGKFGNGNNYCRLTSDTVTISYVGYETITGKKLASTGNDIKMQEVAIELDAANIEAVSFKTICERDNHGTWDAQHTTCRCPSNKPRWERGDTPSCMSICTYLNRHPNEASPERLACCRAGSATKWEGTDTQGNCICINANRQIDASKQWDGASATCVAVNNPPTPEEQCSALGNIVRWDASTSQCVCVDANKRLDGTQCVDKEAPAEEEKTPEEQCTALGNIVRWDASSSTCVCVDENKRLDGSQCVDKDTPANPEKTPEQICNELGADSALWEGGACKCKDPKKEYQNNQCVDKTESVRTPQDACNDLGPGVAVWQNNQCGCKDEVSDFVYNEESKTGQCVVNPEKEKAKALKDKKQAYDDAKNKEQSLANRTLTAATTAATGLGMMELMMGKAEQKADADAEQDMAAYMATMRCTYAGGKSVKAGPEEVELPGGNDGKLMSYRSEYIALAKSLKERKTAMDMLPGIESEEILDKAEMGLYDDESKGIEGGAYASLYRAKQGSEEDQKKIDADKEKSAKRVKYGATALAAGAAVGVVGNSLINGKLGEKIFSKEGVKKGKIENRAVINHKDPEKMEQEKETDPGDKEQKPNIDVSAIAGGSDAGGVGAIIGGIIGGSTDKGSASGGGNLNTTNPTVASQRISIDEPDVDGTKWEEVPYQQCFVNFFPRNDKYSSNVRSYWAKSHNTKYCSGYTGGKYIYDYKKNPNPCNQQKFRSLNPGEWEIQIRNGNKSVKGIAVCNNTAGTEVDELRDNVDPHTNNGRHCWCKITQTDLSECLVTQKFSWEYKGDLGLVDADDVEFFNDYKADPTGVDSLYPAAYYEVGQNNCLWQCADACAYNLLDYGRHRQRQMHGVPLIRDFIERLQRQSS